MGADPGALRARLRALAGGHWSSWAGLEPLPSDEEVAEQLGDPLEPEPHGGMFAGAPTMFRRYTPGGSLPFVIVWYEGDVAVAVQIERPVRAVDDPPLPEPDLVIPSAVGERWEQRIHGAAGLVLHAAADDSGDVALLIALPPFAADDFEHDPVRHEGATRRR